MKSISSVMRDLDVKDRGVIERGIVDKNVERGCLRLARVGGRE